MAQLARVFDFQFEQEADAAFGDDDGGTWEYLEKWADESDARRAEIADRAERAPGYDPWDDLDEWECDRQALVLTLKTTPSPHLRALRLKARVVAYARTGPLGNFGFRPPGEGLAEIIVQDLLALGPLTAADAQRRPSSPKLVMVR